MPLTEAVSKFIKDGDTLASCNFLHANPYAIIYEIIRQKKKNLTVAIASAIEEVDLLLSGGCVSKIITSYYHRAGGKNYKRELDRALLDERVIIEDYTNFTMCAMFMAGALGYDFLPVMKSVKESDIFNVRTFKKDNKMKVIKSPFTGKDTVVVPALNPDIAIIHVQRADKYGNAQFWGSEGSVKWAALSADKIIVTCEEIVENEKIRRSPFLTKIPSFRVNAVCKVPWGAHPSPVAGYYNTDIMFRSMYFGHALSDTGNKNFMEEWVYGLKNREDYMNHYRERFGNEPLNYLKIFEYKSDQVNLGFKKTYWQDDFCYNIALTREEYKELTEKYGELEL